MMYWLWILVVFSVRPVGGVKEECDPTKHVVINDPYRSIGYVLHKDRDPEAICDNNVSQGWYRFRGQGDNLVMPTTCPMRFRCGTATPIWLDGSHPSQDEGRVIRAACGNNGQCCGLKLSIEVTNCGGFFVYHLKDTPMCPAAYCAGTDAPCPPEQFSATMYPPCSNLTSGKRPTISGPLISKDKSSFSVTCKIHESYTLPNQSYVVTWTFDGKPDPAVEPVTLYEPQKTVTLPGNLIKGHMGSGVGCEVKGVYQGPGRVHESTPVMSHNRYYPMISINPSPMVINSHEYSKTMKMVSSIPVTCDSNGKNCCMDFVIKIPDNVGLVVQDSCKARLCAKDWDTTSHQAQVDVSLKVVNDTPGADSVHMGLETSGRHQDVFTGAKLSPVDVKMEPRVNYTCIISHQTQIQGMEAPQVYHSYHLHGNFTVFTEPSRNLSVQVRTWPCFDNITYCVCGIAVREGNNVVRASICEQIMGGHATTPVVSVPRNLTNGAAIARSANKRDLDVYLPSGTQVLFHANHVFMFIQITSPGTDFGKISGLCGTNDGDPDNDFMHPDGTVDPMCSSSDPMCRPTAFIESWRVSQADNLFDNLPPEVPDDSKTPAVTPNVCNCQDPSQAYCSSTDSFLMAQQHQQFCWSCITNYGPAIVKNNNNNKPHP